MGCFVTVMFAHILVGTLASRHLRAAYPPQVPLNTFPFLRDQIAGASPCITLP